MSHKVRLAGPALATLVSLAGVAHATGTNATGTAATAAPAPGPAVAPVSVAAPPVPPAGRGAATSAAPTGVPAAGAGTRPAVVAASAATAPAVASSAPAATVSAEPAKPAWSGSSVSLAHHATTLTFAPGAELTYNPTVYQVLGIDPRYKLSDEITLSAHAEVTTEYTNSDTTTRRREPLLGDIWFKGTYALALPAAMKGSAGLRLSTPTSKESIARRRIASFKPSFDVGRPVPLGSVVMTVRGGVAASYTLATSRVLVYDAPSNVSCKPTDLGGCTEFDHAGSRSALAAFEQTLGADFALTKKLTGQLRVLWIQSILHPLDEIENPATGMPVPSEEGSTRWRFANAYVLGLSWAVAEHWSLGGGLQTISPLQKPDSSYYRPFFNRYTEVFVTAGYSL